MHWVVGIDEAGYGPNLGPLVQAAIAVRLPRTDSAGWDSLRPFVRRQAEPDDGRVLVDDSKLVHSGAKGLERLERGLAAVLGWSADTLGAWLQQHTLPGVFEDLTQEAWFESTEPVPIFLKAATDYRPLLQEHGIEIQIVATNLVCAPLFNQVVAGSGSKGTILSAGVSGLLNAVRRALPPDLPMTVHCDKLGGRNQYAPLLQAAFAEGWPHARTEGAEESRYVIEGLNQNLQVIFRPRSDSECISVALASMLAKYLREVCMRQFNRYWAQHVPGLKPTAGYPVDAKRFYADIRPAMAKLGLEEEAVWRCR